MEKLVTQLRSQWTSYDSLIQRIVTAAILGPILLAAIWAGGVIFTFVVILGAVLSMREWLALVEKPLPPRILFAFLGMTALSLLLVHFIPLHFGPLKIVIVTLIAWIFALRELAKRDQFALGRWAMAGVFYIGLPCACMIWLRRNGALFSPHEWAPLMLLFLQIWATDVGAYFVGRAVGGPRLAPVISPNKTWSGLIGGVVASALVSCMFAGIWELRFWGVYFIVGIFLAVIAQGGDLFESYVKRRAGVKDSGNLIPGHGGILDRIDALLAVAPFFVFIVAMLG